jgi:NOL1/NOP2/sun family putative RNA methylase
LQLPATFIHSLEQIKGFNKDAFEAVHESGTQVTSIRLNTSKFKVPLENFSIDGSVPWCSTGLYLSKRPSFTSDPLFHAGAYYVQEASSMFLAEVLTQTIDVTQPIKVLDLCAAPGGKSTLIQSIISNQSLLVSNEVIKTRVTVLSENISKWGCANVIVTNNDPKDFQRLQNFFDVVVVDAPCSGSGLFRKDLAAVTEWSEQNVLLCSQRQQRILSDIMPSLKDGGILIYSTCSYSKEEDEEISDWLMEELKMESVELKVDAGWGIVGTKSTNHNAYGYRFYPDKLKGEGFFIAAFKKAATGNVERQAGKHRSKLEKLTAKEIEVIKPYLKDATNFFFIKQNEEAIAVPSYFENDLVAIQSALYIKKAGVRLGTIIRNELVPDHEFAMSTIINDGVPMVAVDESTALQYLRRQEIKIDSDIKGWTLIIFQQLPLGWIKILPGRVNNYYPKEWRILNK